MSPDQTKCLDWRIRKDVKNGTATLDVVEETRSKLQSLL
jgi:hypothetical protein